MLWAVSLSTMELIPHSLTAALSLTGIRSLAKVSNPVGPIAYPVLYLRQETHDAAPKCISGRTSYHGDRADRKSTRLNSSHVKISYAVFCLKKKKKKNR